jgi:AraC family transcriptional regulator
MRRYDAPLIARRALDLGAVKVELIERAPTDGPVVLEVCLPDHMVFVELKAGASCERRIDGGAVERFVSRPGMFSFRPAGSIVRGMTQSRTPIRYGAIRIDPLGLQNELATRMLPALWRSATACRVRPIWQDALALLRATTQPRITDPMLERLNIEGHAVALLARLAARFTGTVGPSRAGLSPRRLAAVIDYAHAHVDDAITLASLASIARLSRSQLIRSLQAATGLTPLAFVARLRVQEARRVLAATDLPIAEVAVHLGFADQSHFTRRFRAGTGMTPAHSSTIPTDVALIN